MKYTKEDSRKAQQRRDVTNLFPLAEEWELDVLSTLPTGEFAIWLTMAKHGTSDMCRSCIQDAVRSVVELGTNGSGPLRNLRKRGLDISNGKRRSGCPKHVGVTTWQALRNPMPDASGSSSRAVYSAVERKKMLKILGGRDAFTDTGGVELEIDHRVPFQRQVGTEPKVDVDNYAEVSEHYMCLTRSNNTMKREKCLSCISTEKRPAFLGMPFYYDGSEDYDATVGCVGCGYAYPEEWKAQLLSSQAIPLCESENTTKLRSVPSDQQNPVTD